MSGASDEQLNFLRALARKHPAPTPEIGVSIAWESDGRELSVYARGEVVHVGFMAGGREVESLTEAAALVAAIFADEVVCVTGFCNGDPVYFDLAQRDDLAGGVAYRDRSRSVDVPQTDSFQAQSWSGARDFDSEA